MQTLLLLSASVFLALTCPSGTGTPSTKGVFNFDIYPPLAWCYTTSALTDDSAAKLASSKDAALKNATGEIKAAIKASLEEYGYGSISFTVELKNYSPVEIKYLGKICPETDTTEGFAYTYSKNTVYYQCIEGKYVENNQSGKAYISSSQQLYDNQWDALAVKVQKKLQTKGVVFDSPLDHGH